MSSSTQVNLQIREGHWQRSVIWTLKVIPNTDISNSVIQKFATQKVANEWGARPIIFTVCKHILQTVSVWNVLPSAVVEAFTFNVFKRMLDCWLAYVGLHLLVFFVYFIVCVYVCGHARASASGLLRPFLSCGFYPLNSSFIHSFIDASASVKVSWGKSLPEPISAC